jgi:hypothetical protein
VGVCFFFFSWLCFGCSFRVCCRGVVSAPVPVPPVHISIKGIWCRVGVSDMVYGTNYINKNINSVGWVSGI